MDDQQILIDVLDRASQALMEMSVPGPEDDWPTLALAGRRDDPKLISSFFELTFINDEERDLVFNQELPAELSSAKAQILALVLPSWRIALEPGQPDPAPEVSPSKHPNRDEIVLITALTRQTTKSRFASVTRYPDRQPTLSRWHEIGAETNYRVTSTLLAPSLLVLTP
jgi:hypothetical protein